MSNYTQFNIYRKQMIELGLNTKQYAQLLEMPYEVVKDIIYDKKGDYSMGIKDLLRKNMMNKHQELEKDFDNTKMKASEIKMNEKINNEIEEWYDKEYTVEMLKEKLNINSNKEFEREYDIMIDGSKASHWFYACLLSKKFLDKIAINVKKQFIEQLYDIIVNDNSSKYKANNKLTVTIKENNEYIDWYKTFNSQEFMKKYNLTNRQIANDMNMAYSSACILTSGNYVSRKGIKKYYEYVNEIEEKNIEVLDIEDKQETYEAKVNENVIDEPYVKVVENGNNTILKPQPVILNVSEIKDDEVLSMPRELAKNIADSIDEHIAKTTNEMLRKILINRLTEEEKTLIKIFGGKIC